MKVALVSGLNRSGDSVRGIGVHNSELFKALRKASNKDITELNIKSNDNLSKFEGVHFTSFRPFYISLPLKKPKNTKFILTIHDLIPLIYPDHYKPGIKGKLKFLVNKYLVKKYVDEIITISETSKKDICRFLEVNPSKVHVIYLGSLEEYKPIIDKNKLDEVRKKFFLPEKFVFYFGDINYNKNIPTLVKACLKANIQLVIAGKQAGDLQSMDLNHPENSHLKEVYDDLLNKSKVTRLGYISDEDANVILNLASVLVQPSFYEGFGLSVIHAMAASCPVVASRTQALVEIAGDTAIYFNPFDVNDLIEKINQITKDNDLRDEYVKKELARVKMFNWKKTAEETLNVYDLI